MQVRDKDARDVLSTLIQNIIKKEGTNESGAIRDILTDIIHICREKGFDPEDRFEAATIVAAEEDEWKAHREDSKAEDAAEAASNE